LHEIKRAGIRAKTRKKKDFMGIMFKSKIATCFKEKQADRLNFRHLSCF
jgi:hypothetical protein